MNTEWHHLDSSKAMSDIRDSAKKKLKTLIPGPLRYQPFSVGLNVSQEGTGCLVTDQGGSDKVAQF